MVGWCGGIRHAVSDTMSSTRRYQAQGDGGARCRGAGIGRVGVVKAQGVRHAVVSEARCQGASVKHASVRHVAVAGRGCRYRRRVSGVVSGRGCQARGRYRRRVSCNGVKRTVSDTMSSTRRYQAQGDGGARVSGTRQYQGAGVRRAAVSGTGRWRGVVLKARVSGARC
jgi:hypothetical protein